MLHDEETVNRWLRPVPKIMTIETTTRCNGRCIICAYKYLNRKNKDAELKEYYDTVRQAIDMGISGLSINHMGEPTLRPEYPEILPALSSMCHSGGHNVHLYHYTNGSQLIRPEILDAVLGCLDEIRISIDGATAEQMKATRPGLDPSAVEEGVRLLYEKRKINGGKKPRIWIRGTILPGIAESEYKNKWGRYCDSTIRMPLIHDVIDRDNCPHRPCRPCADVFTLIAVNVNRNVIACCRDFGEELLYGNLNDNTLSELWYGKRALEIRRLHINNMSSCLKKCSVCPAPKPILIK